MDSTKSLIGNPNAIYNANIQPLRRDIDDLGLDVDVLVDHHELVLLHERPRRFLEC